MKYLPFENITYRTKLDSNEVLKRISEKVEPKKPFRITEIFWENNYKPYKGIVKGKTFNITRIIQYRNSFLPQIKGNVENDINGTKVNIKMRLHPIVLTFMIIWFSGVGIGFLLTLSILLSNKSFEPMTLIPFGMLIFGYALVTGGFKYESIKSKKYFNELFESEFEE